MLNPDMPDQEIRLHMGELTQDELRVAREVIRWANESIKNTTRPSWKKIMGGMRVGDSVILPNRLSAVHLCRTMRFYGARGSYRRGSDGLHIVTRVS